MDTELLKWLAPVIVGPLSAVGGWFFARRQSAAVAQGTELTNEGRAIALYESMVTVAQGSQDRLVAALAEIDRFRVELAVCVQARDQGRRDKLVIEQQATIDRTSSEVAIASLKHQLAAMQMQIVGIHATGLAVAVAAPATGEDG